MGAEFYEQGSSGRLIRRLWLTRRQGDGTLATLLKRYTTLVQDHVKRRRPTDLLAYIAGGVVEPLLDMGSEMKRETTYLRQDFSALTMRIDKSMKERKQRKQEEIGRQIVTQLIVRQPGGAYRLWMRRRQLEKSFRNPK